MHCHVIPHLPGSPGFFLPGEKHANNNQPVLVNRERVQEMLGGISRTTFYRKRKQWEQSGTPFPQEVEEIHPPKGGALFRYVEVIQFCKDKGLLAAHA
ncbi:helix-turn-helix domain-containing protein [Citrobacter braakii]|uniref:helix-turn-helix domain-containing protein n=1 Tax=Citrobacter braakii TaxID=57706 RepID=UPI002964A94B|nr:helix-turn-helix domain-containing protein [Citrobacter braakii]MDW2593241.1 helix-turn-helix domain-containing protein [Citrobacter braakii]MDW2656693.1 helix-turn-helix domain-containing protein [Citrobacter braakii]MDW2704769.1 helix-turn-helix domain-containing protein [Citrobacter braakii]